MKQLFIIYRKENGGFGYKPAKVNLSVGTRICVDKEKMVFAKVEKVVETTAQTMKNNWEVAKAQNRHFDTSANFGVIFLGLF